MGPFHKFATPRQDVLDGAMDKSVYAASLGDLLHHSAAGRTYWDRGEFNRLTYTTDGLGAALDDIRKRLQEQTGSGFRQIVTSFGGGKTHSMIAMYHACRDWGADSVVIDGGDLDPSTQTIWGEIERQLDDTIDRMSGMVAPGGGAILKLLDRPKPVLILIDEIADYLDGSKGVPGGKRKAAAASVGVGDSNMAVQTVTFLQRLSNKVAQLPNVCIVISLPDIDQVSEKEHYAQVQRVASRRKQIVTVATYDDIPHIVRRRLFETGEDIMSDRASDTIQEYVAECVRGHSIPQDEAAAYAERFRSTYPFTPDVIDVLYKRWGSYPSFQRTRGVLRLLSSVVHSLLKSDRPYITLSDIDLNVNEIRTELTDHVGQNIESVVGMDITSEQSNAAQLGEAAVRAARTIFMYSFPAENRGATEDDIKRAAFTGEINHSAVGDILTKMQRRLFYLALTDDGMFRFTHDENINKLIDRALHSVNDTDTEDEERDILGRGTGTKFRKVYVWPEHYVRIDDIAGLQLVILKEADTKYCKDTVANVSSKSRRVNQNALVFVLPAGNGRLSESIRRLLAVRRVRSIHTDLKPADVRVLKDAEREAQGGIEVGMREKYTEVWLPDRDDVIRQCRISHRHPDEDVRPFGDVMWEKLVAEFQIAERLDPELVRDMNGSAENIYSRMMRTCGERRPASLDVVSDAVESLKVPEESEPPAGGGDVFGDDDAVVDSPPRSTGRPAPSEPEQPEEEPALPPVAGVHCSDVVSRDMMSAWGKNMFTTLGKKYTTTVRLTVDQKDADTFSIRLDMAGDIPGEVADSIRQSISSNGNYREDPNW